jgi:hypothetical protein
MGTSTLQTVGDNNQESNMSQAQGLRVVRLNKFSEPWLSDGPRSFRFSPFSGACSGGRNLKSPFSVDQWVY